MIRLKDYDYFVHPLTDGVSPVSPDLLAEAVDGLVGMLPRRVDVLLAPEAMALPLAAGLALRAGHPYVIARKRPYALPGEVVAPYATGYSQGRLYVNGILPGQEVVMVDDVLSRGGTVRALAKAVKAAGARLTKVVVLANKGHDLDALSKEIGAPVAALLTIRVHEGRVQVLNDHATPRV